MINEIESIRKRKSLQLCSSVTSELLRLAPNSGWSIFEIPSWGPDYYLCTIVEYHQMQPLPGGQYEYRLTIVLKGVKISWFQQLWIRLSGGHVSDSLGQESRCKQLVLVR